LTWGRIPAENIAGKERIIVIQVHDAVEADGKGSQLDWTRIDLPSS
jgi:hypothetical protein